MSVKEQREEVQRVLGSAQFRRAPKLQRFLSLICGYHFEHRSDEINEYVIALEAFGKGPDFDASQDSLVRVQAREARRRLQEYYQNEGKDSKVILGIPLGSYAPVFSAPADPSPPKRVPMLRTAWVMLASTALICAVLLFSADRQRRLWIGASNIASAQAASGAMTPLVSRLWNRFLESESPTVLVLSNPDVGECTDTQPAEKGPSEGAVKETPCPDEYTGMGEAVAINLFTNLFQARKKTLIVKQSRMVNEDDVKRYNLILLGGRKVNTWTGRLGDDLKLAPDATDVVLTRPAAASTPKFETAFDGKTGQLISDRGLIALRRHPTTGHWLLFLYGKHTQGTHGAAEGSTQERFLAQLQWPKSSSPVPDSFRVLLAVTVRDGIPEGPVPIALRVP
jgi:hypothetical protein